ncbi:MAG: response regulator [Bdellovibrionales bacterium]
MKTLYFIDDEKEIHTLFDFFLAPIVEEGKLSVKNFHSVEEYESFQNEVNWTPVDMIVTDVNMPGKNGMDLVEETIKHVPDARIFVLTAYNAKEMQKKAMDLGASGFYSKPIRMQEFKDTLLAELGIS